MKYLFLSLLMIGVGIGIVGCNDDDPASEQTADEEGSGSMPYPDISGLWYHYEVTTGTNGPRSAGVRDLRIRQSGEGITVEHIDFSSPTSDPYATYTGYVTEEYTVAWDDYSGSISEDAWGMSGSNDFEWGSSVWSADKLSDE